MPTARTDTLDEIVRLIVEVEKTLDKSSAKCPACGGTRYTNWTESGCREWLQAARKRVERVARTLEGP